MGIYSKQEILKIIKDMGCINTSITYEEFKELHSKLGAGTKEVYFAEILGINYSNYMSFKEGKNRATILKHYNSQDINIDQIRNKIIEIGYKNTAIDYEEFKHLYSILGKNMKESEFAQILGIRYPNYHNMKNKGTRAIVLKEGLVELTQTEKTKIIEQIQSFGYKRNDSISYEEFLILYEKFNTKLSKPDFAQVLGINYSNYNDMKSKKTKARILNDQKEITEEEKEQIRNRMILDGYENKNISYEEFKILHEKYAHGISQTEFLKILSIKYNNFHSMKSNKGTTRILKRNITEEEKKEIKNSLVKKGYLGTAIDYEEFLKLYNQYAQRIDKTDFAKILEIKYASYNNMKNGKSRARILKKYTVPEEIRSQYNCIEILKNCSENGMNKKDALKYVKNLLKMTNKQILQKIDECLKNNEREER